MKNMDTLYTFLLRYTRNSVRDNEIHFYFHNQFGQASIEIQRKTS